MPNPEWGVKRVCPTTGLRFYDLNRSPVVSPYTGEVVEIDTARRKVAVSAGRGIAAKEKSPVAETTDTDDDLLVDDAADDADLDDDLLDDDEDDTVSLDELADVSDDED